MKNEFKDPLERAITNTLHTTVQDLHPSAECKTEIWQQIYYQEQKGRGKMRKHRRTKIAAIVVACTLLLSVGVYAAGNMIGIISTSDSGYDYTKYQDVEKAKEETGVPATLPETLADGYVFEGVRLIDVADVDEDNLKHNKRLELNASYSKGQEVLEVFAENGKLKENDEEICTEKRIIEGTKVYFMAVETLYLPAGEKPTAAEQQRAASDPCFTISYGSNKREAGKYTQARFEKEGVVYTLFSDQAVLSANQLFDAAAEIIK